MTDGADPESGAEDAERARPSFIRFRPAEPVDFQDEPPTVRTTSKGPGASPSESRRFRDALANDHLNLTVNLLHLQRMLDGASSILRGHTQELADVLHGLEAVIEHAYDPTVAPLLAPGSALAAYIKGLYLWCDGIIEALEEACDAARAYRDQAAVRWRLVESSHFYFDGLAPRIRDDVRGLCIEEPIEELLWAAAWMHDSMAKSLRG